MSEGCVVAWVRFDDRWPRQPEIAGLSDPAFRTHASALCAIAEFRSNGWIREEQLPLLGIGRFRKAVEELVDRGLWRAGAGGYMVETWEQHALSRERAEDISQKRSRAGSKGAASRWQEPSQVATQTDGNAMAEPEPEPEPDNPSGSGELQELIDWLESELGNDIAYLAGKTFKLWTLNSEEMVTCVLKAREDYGLKAVHEAFMSLAEGNGPTTPANPAAYVRATVDRIVRDDPAIVRKAPER
jgi:hypothetical protein